MIIDCHGHYTTIPKRFEDYRRLQVQACGCGQPQPLLPAAASDDELRESVETAQLQRQRDRGTDLTIFSPRAIGMGHHLGDRATSEAWPIRSGRLPGGAKRSRSAPASCGCVWRCRSPSTTSTSMRSETATAGFSSIPA